MVAGRSLSVTANKAAVNEAAATLNYERERRREKERREEEEMSTALAQHIRHATWFGVVSTHVSHRPVSHVTTVGIIESHQSS
jgi:hypothetical protein